MLLMKIPHPDLCLHSLPSQELLIVRTPFHPSTFLDTADWSDTLRRLRRQVVSNRAVLPKNVLHEVTVSHCHNNLWTSRTRTSALTSVCTFLIQCQCPTVAPYYRRVAASPPAAADLPRARLLVSSGHVRGFPYCSSLCRVSLRCSLPSLPQ